MNLLFVSVIAMTVLVSAAFLLFLNVAMKKGKEDNNGKPHDNHEKV